MAVEIPLYQRTGLPPSRVGAAKPPLSLADRPGERQLGQVIAGLGGKTWNEIIRSQAANEVAEARGQVNTLIESFHTYTADNPNASPEELKKEWDRVSTQIKGLPTTLKTGIAKDDFGNFLALNEGVINQRAQTGMESIKSRQELTRAEVQRDLDMTNLDAKSRAANSKAMVEAGTWDAESEGLRLERDIEIIGSAQEKVALAKAREAITGTYQAIIDSGGTAAEASAVIDAAAKEGIIPPTMKGTLKNNLESYIANQNKRATSAKFTKTVNSYRELSEKIINNDFTADDIELAGFDKETKKLWDGYLDGYIEDSKKDESELTEKGQSNVINAVTGFSSGTVNKQDAYDVVLKERYENRSITDDEFAWAIGKIENPYPKEMASHIDAVVQQNRKANSSIDWFTQKNEKAIAQANNDFMKWVDNEIKKGRSPDLQAIHKGFVDYISQIPLEPSREPSANELRLQNTQESYDRGVELGYWKE